MPPPHRIRISPVALESLQAVRDRRIRDQIQAKIDGLAQDPELQGKALGDELVGYRALRAAGQRYRILYRVVRDAVEVLVVLVGIRKEGHRDDVYRVAERLIRLKLLP